MLFVFPFVLLTFSSDFKSLSLETKLNNDLSGDRPLYEMVASELDVMGKVFFGLSLNGEIS